MEVQQDPPDMQTWAQRAQWIIDGFCDHSRRSERFLKEFLTICNSNTKEENIIHWCKGCCATNEEAMDKTLRCAVPLFSRGFQVPLLYRFKHYAHAASFVKTMCCCFSLLPRVLAQMEENSVNQSDASARLSGMVDALLQDVAATPLTQGAEEFQSRLDELLDNDLSFSVQNSVRKKLVSQEVSKPGFAQAAIVIDIIVGAMEYGMHVFFQRTGWLSQICALGSHHGEYASLVEKSKTSFLQIVSGDLGRVLIGRTMSLLDDGLAKAITMGVDATAERLRLFFNLVVACASDLFRRMVLEFSHYPFCLFEWLSPGYTVDQFAQFWDRLVEHKSKCPGCVDLSFTSVILDENPGPLSGQPRDYQEHFFSDMKGLLTHIASYTPVNSDTVEVKHGNMQWASSQRGSIHVKKQRAAKETSLLQSVIRSHGLAYRDTYDSTMPAKQVRSGMHKRFGRSGCNQFSKRRGPDQD